MLGATLAGRAFHRWRAALPHVAVVLLGLLCAVVETYPLVRQLGDHLPGTADLHDPASFVWNNWWIRHALVDLHQKPYFTRYLLVPFPLDLRLHTFGLLYGLASIPILPLVGPIALSNLQIFATAALNAYAVFLLIRKWSGRTDVAVVCGGALASAQAVTFHFLSGRPCCSAIWPVALGLLFLARLIEDPRSRNGLAFGASLVVMLMVDQQMSIFGGLLFTVYLAGIAATRPALFQRRALWIQAALVLAVIAYPVRLLFVRPYLQTPGYTVPGPDEAIRYSAPFTHLFLRAGFWRAYGLLLGVGMFAGLIELASRRRDRRVVFGVLCALLGLALTWGPVVPGTHIPLPFGLVRHIPGLSMFRAPYRFQIVAAFGMTLALAGLLGRWLPQLPSARRCQAIVGVLLFVIVAEAIAHRAVVGFQTHAIRIDPIYETIARMPGDFVVLEVPLGVRCGTDLIGRGDDFMLFQTVHGKRMINEYLSRVPLVALDYYRTSPAFMFLGGERPPPGDIAADLDARIRDLDVGVVVVHPEELTGDRLTAILALLRQRQDLEPIATDGTAMLAFRVRH